ncbi:related to SKT5 protein [Rhynchosporium agropyri]|uniref:Related to SKT5 protein n=1 Tax=Rhynchosporium agropyri TaxID=914238 RepID=A0A1E1KTB6_9HELO|nr:related to SKT5 protein [Rhynchosporium agropyri]
MSYAYGDQGRTRGANDNPRGTNDWNRGHYHQQQLQQQQQQDYGYNYNQAQVQEQQYHSQHLLYDEQNYHQQVQAQRPRYANMGDQDYLQKPMQATFYPSQNDDFFMPELISPTPTRIMPEVPSNMQEGLAHLELEARNPQSRMSASSTVSSMQSPAHQDMQSYNRTSHNSRGSGGPGFTASYDHTNASAYQNINRDCQQFGPLDSPKFSPFPKLQNPGQNVPLSDEDKEEVLERARNLVLKSTDPEMQLAWAQDALSWVEVASQAAIRQQPEGQNARSITPKVEHQLREDALNIVRFLADQHHPKAEFMKSMWLEFGKFGYRVDKKEAFLGYKRSADKGYPRAEYRIGMQYENSNNSVKAVEHYQKGVAMRDSASNYRLGMMTLLGQHGMPQDYQRGVDLIQFAADTADENAPQGAYVYGMLLARELPNIVIPEQFLEYNNNDAKMFVEKAAYLGFAKAQLKMAQAYELCQLSCEFEPALSMHYNALAARQGEPEAEMAISKWFLCGYEGIFDKNEELAFMYAKRAAQAKLPTAEFAMGYFYEIGMHVECDLRESEMWYTKASEHGNKDALGRIDSIRKNSAFTKDHEQIAISRIKSQYGSQRGARPDRFKQKTAPLPSFQEEQVEMPEARDSYGNFAPLRVLQTVAPDRPASAAPYPEDDMAQIGRYSQQSQGLRPILGGGPQADRPASAFGIRPVSHANTGNFDQGGLRPNGQSRPATSMGNMPQHPPPGGRGGPPGGRVASGGWDPQIPNRGPSQAPTLPQVNMGRPFDPVQRKPQPSHSQTSPGYPPYGGPSPQQGVPQRRPQAANYQETSGRAGSLQPNGGMMSPPMKGSQHYQQPQQQQQQRPDSQAGRQSQRPPQHTMSSQQQQPHQQQQANSRPQSAAPSVASSSAPSSSQGSQPPKKQGPSTFEEMGIPAGKNESDCIIM